MRGKSGREQGLPPGGGGLFAGLVDAADEDVVDQAGIEVVAGDEPGQDLGEQIAGVHPGQRSLRSAPSGGGSDGVDDDSAGHGRSSSREINS